MDDLPLRDNEGYLLDPQQWQPALISWLAQDSAQALTPSHIDIILKLRQFYCDYGHAPAMRPLVTYLKQQLGEAQGNSHYLMTLFGGSPAKQIAKLAGLPKPKNCL